MSAPRAPSDLERSPTPLASAATSRRATTPGDRYTLRERVGQGGMAEIFRAESIDSKGNLHTVILKFLRPDASEEAMQLFDLEADLMNLLYHPNLVSRVEVGVLGGRAFIAMEDCYGGDLRSLIEAHTETQDGVPHEIAIHILTEVLRGLAYFHKAQSAAERPLGLVHGDVNPSNIFLSVSGEVKLGDFGVATVTELGTGVLMDEGVALGKKHYLAPELIRGEPRTQSIDLFAMGVMLFELCVGYRPFDGASQDEIFRAIATAKVEIPAGLVEPALAKIIRRSLARAPRSRYPTAGALCGELVRYQLDRGLQLPPRAFEEYLAERLGVLA